MNKPQAGPYHWALLAVLFLAGLFWSGVVNAQMQTTNQARIVSGTYRVMFCRHACNLADSSTAIATGYIVLSRTPITLAKLPKKRREYFGELYRAIALRAEPNACFVLMKRHPGNSAATALPVGFTSWKDHQHTINLDLFRAPDSGYTLYLTISDDTLLRGVGQFWSGNGPEAQLPPDSVAGRRIGAAKPSLCIDAARRETFK